MTDEIDDNKPIDEWTVEAFLGILRRQATGLKAIRDWLDKEPTAMPADGSPQRMEAILALKAICQYANEIARALKQEKNDDQNDGKTP